MISFYRLAPCAIVLLLGGCAATQGIVGNEVKTPAATVTAVAPVTAEQQIATPRPATRRQEPTARPISIMPQGPLEPLAPNSATAGEVAPLTPPANLWARIQRGYAMPDLDNELVREQERWYASRPDYIARMTERSSKYLFHVVEELERRNMPAELALLPFIESAFNPQAVSSAKAAGMWQFMPATGKNFELKQNAFRDDRRDVLASTRAALDYLQKLQTMFGDWHLALAAYNWGEGSVRRAIEKNKRANRGTGYLDLTMPAETRMYVPKLQAVKNIVSGSVALNASLPAIDNHPYFQSVDILRDIDVAMAAKLAGVALEDFKALNPSAKRPVILAAGTPQILLPWDNAATFRANLKANANTQLASWTVWRAPLNMHPAVAAAKAGMEESELRAVNSIPRGVVIKAGSALLVTRSAKLREEVAETIADNGQLSLSPEALKVRRSVRARNNESVAALARRYRTSAASVAQWNQVGTSSSFKTGQAVTLYVTARAKSVSSGTKTASAKWTRRSKVKPVQVAKD